MADAMIRLDAVIKRFPGGSAPAVDRLSLDVPEGELVVLVGPSGCGKTTTLKMINRIVEPTDGRIEVAGRDVLATDPHRLRLDIGYVIQQIGLFPHKTVAANIATVPRLLGWDRARIRARVEELLDVMSLEADMLGRYPSELSGGQRQRVGVARALAADPPVLLMDEPYGAVDPLVRSRLQEQLIQLQRDLGKTIVFVTHDIDEAIKLGDRIAILNIGGLLEQYDTPAAILHAPASDFVASFLGDERGLKRLSLIPVTRVPLERGPVVPATAFATEARQVATEHGDDWVGVLDGERLRGWLWVDELDAARALGEHEVHDFRVWIEDDASLRAAVDAIVTTRGNVAVVYHESTYRGLLRIEQVAAELIS